MAPLCHGQRRPDPLDSPGPLCRPMPKQTDHLSQNSKLSLQRKMQHQTQEYPGFCSPSEGHSISSRTEDKPAPANSPRGAAGR